MNVAGTTLETPIAMPIMVMLSPTVGLVRKNKISGAGFRPIPCQIWSTLLPSMTDCRSWDVGTGESFSMKLTIVPSNTKNDDTRVSQ